jgi:hypothetical protein
MNQSDPTNTHDTDFSQQMLLATWFYSVGTNIMKYQVQSE